MDIGEGRIILFKSIDHIVRYKCLTCNYVSKFADFTLAQSHKIVDEMQRSNCLDICDLVCMPNYP